MYFLLYIRDLSFKIFKVDPKSNAVFGSNDLDFDDKTVYDYVISTADVGAVQSILNNTYDNYKDISTITQSLNICNNNSVSQMKIAPDYRVSFISSSITIQEYRFVLKKFKCILLTNENFKRNNLNLKC